MLPLRQFNKMSGEVVKKIECQRTTATIAYDAFAKFLYDYKSIFELSENSMEQKSFMFGRPQLHTDSSLLLLLARAPAEIMTNFNGKPKEAW